MTHYLKVFWLFAFLWGCSFSESPPLTPYAEQLASRNEKVEYTGQFQYSLKDCEGPMATHYNNYSHTSHSLSMTVDRSRVEFIRHDKKNNEPKLIGNWNVNDQTLSRISSIGSTWGIAEIEDWRNSIGVMVLQQDEILGQIRNINISSQGTFCEVDLKFTGATI